jgi:RimJ/RimL family protein N-acetyltransferase
MTTYRGAPRGSGQVQLTEPSGANLIALGDSETWHRAGGVQEGVAEAVESWTEAALARDDVLLFEIAEGGRPVGQIFLHDINYVTRESLIGYHLLADEHRGRGVGTTALGLILEYVREETDLKHLVIITSGDNARSRRIAEKNGFVLAGPPREDPTGLCFKLEMSRS